MSLQESAATVEEPHEVDDKAVVGAEQPLAASAHYLQIDAIFQNAKRYIIKDGTSMKAYTCRGDIACQVCYICRH